MGCYICLRKSQDMLPLAKPDPSKLDIISEFKITEGDGPFWAHPVISKGKLYIRHGDALMVYALKPL